VILVGLIFFRAKMAEVDRPFCSEESRAGRRRTAADRTVDLRPELAGLGNFIANKQL
jgi:hypothetical protein